MKKNYLFILTILAGVILALSCKRTANDATYVSKVKVVAASYFSGDTLHGTIKGSLAPNKRYYMDSSVTIPAGDTLMILAGDTIYVINPAAYFLVQGILVSKGTQAAPIWITVLPTAIPKNNDVADASNPGGDPAFISPNLWSGIQCDTSCTFLVLKWTHVEFVGQPFSTPPITTLSGTSWPIYFSNPNGNLIFEDSWIYGCVDDAIRFAGGKICVMRCTLEKTGLSGGDCLNAKHGTVGIMAYNLFVGTCTNGTKASDKGSSTAPQCQIDIYNNTYVNGGFRQASAAKGANIDYEQNAYGLSYNNLIVNCKVGFRVVGAPAADTADLKYGNIYSYGDSAGYVDEFFPTGNITYPETTDIPNPFNYLPAGYMDSLGEVYSASQLIGANNPMFVNYPLPCPSGAVIDYVGSYNFRIQGTSPAAGKGNTSWTPMTNPVPIDSIFGATLITPPGKDIGCYQLDNSGNQH